MSRELGGGGDGDEGGGLVGFWRMLGEMAREMIIGGALAGWDWIWG